MHTMAKVKNLLLESGEQPEPRRREDGEHRIVDGATRLIANTGTEAAELVSHYNADNDHIDVAPPGVDLTVFTPAFRSRARADHGVPPDRFHLLFAGRIQRLKGPQILIKAAALLRSRRPDIDLQLTIVGAVSGAKDFDLKAADQRPPEWTTSSRHHPPVNAPELAGWYRSADVVVMPSYSESFGLVALEAQACGTPVVATKVGGLSRAIFDGRTGLLVEGHKRRRLGRRPRSPVRRPRDPPGHGPGRCPARPGLRLAAHRRHHAGELPHRAEPVLWKPDHPGGPHARSRGNRPVTPA